MSEQLTTEMLPLGATVRIGEKAAAIWGRSFCDPPKYLLLFKDRTMRDNVLPDEIEVLCSTPSEEIVARLAMSNPRAVG